MAPFPQRAMQMDLEPHGQWLCHLPPVSPGVKSHKLTVPQFLHLFNGAKTLSQRVFVKCKWVDTGKTLTAVSCIQQELKMNCSHRYQHKYDHTSWHSVSWMLFHLDHEDWLVWTIHSNYISHVGQVLSVITSEEMKEPVYYIHPRQPGFGLASFATFSLEKNVSKNRSCSKTIWHAQIRAYKTNT